jgi:diaminohydroxyphosphoribosylaminopyrimidine deaminase/5-amino-6-(5-phosphoribosylamino)uracil reductase
MHWFHFFLYRNKIFCFTFIKKKKESKMKFMVEALRIAEHGRFTCMPNPMVGCVIVKNNHIVGSGAHLKAGEHHAEINALIEAGALACGADVYLTLEPCSHFGRTPPCVDALIAASVKSVHIAISDPNPLVAGKGITKLHQAGISVFLGECAQEAYELNKVFFYYITHKKPFVIAKWAMSLDGKIARNRNDALHRNNWITSESARAHAHSLRAQVGAIMVGENTVRLDDPELTVRYGMGDGLYTLPRPIVLTVEGNLAHNSKLFAAGRNTLVMTSHKACPNFLAMLDKNNIEHCFVSSDNNFLSLPEILDKLGSLGISSVLVEGGSQLLTSFFNAGLVNKIYTYMAPKIIGGADSLSPIMGNNFLQKHSEFYVKSKEIVQLGPDICFVSETSLTPAMYDDFIATCKESRECLVV